VVNFLIVTHGEFGAYLVEAAESIAGQQAKGLRVISISSRLSVPEIRERIAKAVKDLRGPDGLILLTDMPGGTPSNIAFPLIKDESKVEMISGVNLNMLVCAFSHREDMTLEQLVEKLMTDGQRAVRDIRKMFVTGAAKAR
jgi:mannose/fructose/sorbose-specific phosphotransferase system IIA component